ncbi:agmatinase [Peribacillus frigoritolerans]|jgi:agmatinase|uniref:Agmatinase n=1 Tax=Peribacillus simplex TaxID=1478 RepID=A0A9W4KNB0_9BACI|nr:MULTISPECIES: agmatinase [Bacillaceae]KRF50895.1 agmatinase [Bacillus sp. Soil745]MBD8137894.1 agmatinase [Bacillus sp. CFBP 13597]MBT2604093.1 agmatinase [Bacillus sp. ISL-53]MBT2670259.1 agmatinase [Streptomyces sp. ISL-14]MDP9738323.1 agmatinase [Bacillus sp. B2I3]PEF37521.1 agmatinase [Bacillus sp. AFS094228]PEO49875.1 agmatinase [Bacillus sp. AFS026049]PHD77478.1 agmatinase [Bacillus sp. AFS043905]QNK49556.1 agmatinase [Brevibacterium sp. PAMC23299]TDL87304.1 agmatinase [Vibrio vu
MKFDEAYSGNVFIKSHPVFEESEAVLYGMPMDWTVSFRPGSRFGPTRIREVSIGLEEYSPYLDRELEEVKFFDAGDIPLPFGNPQRSIDMIEKFVDSLLDAGKFPMGMGGEHLVTWPVIKAMFKKYPDMAIIHMDAHTDLREDYEGEPLSHASIIRKSAELIGPKNVYSFGIRSGLKEEFQWAKENGMHISKFEVLEPLKEVLPQLAGRPVYVTIDIDVLDPAHAPGTGTVDCGGITSKELLASIHEIARSEINVVGCDLVEVAPIYDPSEQTANTASKLIREMILGWVQKG